MKSIGLKNAMRCPTTLFNVQNPHDFLYKVLTAPCMKSIGLKNAMRCPTTLCNVQNPHDFLYKVLTAPCMKSIGLKNAMRCPTTLCNVQNPHDFLCKVRGFKTYLVFIIQSHNPTVANPITQTHCCQSQHLSAFFCEFYILTNLHESA